MAFDAPRTADTADLPQRSDYKRSRTVLIAVALAAGALRLRHRVIEPLTGTPELRVWDPVRGGPTVVVRADTEADPGRRGDGLELLVRVDAQQDEAARYTPPRFVRLEDDDAAGAAQQIAQMLEEGMVTPAEQPHLRSFDVAEFDPAKRARRALVKLADLIESISTKRATISPGTPEAGGDILRCWNPHHQHNTLDVVCETAACEWPKAPLSFLLEPEGEVLATADQPLVAAKKLIARLEVRM